MPERPMRQIWDNGWAYIEEAKFPPNAFTIYQPDELRFRAECIREGRFDGKGYGEGHSIQILVEFGERTVKTILEPMVKAQSDQEWEAGLEDQKFVEECENFKDALVEAKDALK